MVSLSQEELENLKHYKYVCCGLGPFSRFMNKYHWEPSAARLPKNLAPNAITIISSLSIISMTFVLVLQSNLPLTVHPPICYLLLATIGYYIYNFLDILDGKQARNLKVSSPLGQLLDHGLDGSFNTTCISIINVIMLGICDTQKALMILLPIQGSFFLAGWNEHHTGVLRFQLFGFGVQEIAWINYTCLITTVIKGYDIWDIESFGLLRKDIFIYTLFSM